MYQSRRTFHRHPRCTARHPSWIQLSVRKLPRLMKLGATKSPLQQFQERTPVGARLCAARSQHLPSVQPLRDEVFAEPFSSHRSLVGSEISTSSARRWTDRGNEARRLRAKKISPLRTEGRGRAVNLSPSREDESGDGRVEESEDAG